jgi:hypothetical protein
MRFSLLALVVPLATARITTEAEHRCLALNNVCIEPGACITEAAHHAYRNNVEIWDVDRNITRLPPACELWIDIVTNNATGKRVQAVVWMPEDWNGRLLAFGQGGIGLVGEDPRAQFVLVRSRTATLISRQSKLP